MKADLRRASAARVRILKDNPVSITLIQARCPDEEAFKLGQINVDR